MQQTAVKRRAPHASRFSRWSSLSLVAGSRRCVGDVDEAGHTTLPEASTVPGRRGVKSLAAFFAIRPCGDQRPGPVTPAAGSSAPARSIRRVMPAGPPQRTGTAHRQWPRPFGSTWSRITSKRLVATSGASLRAAVDRAGVHDEHVGPTVLRAGEGQPPDAGVRSRTEGMKAPPHRVVLAAAGHDHAPRWARASPAVLTLTPASQAGGSASGGPPPHVMPFIHHPLDIGARPRGMWVTSPTMVTFSPSSAPSSPGS